MPAIADITQWDSAEMRKKADGEIEERRIFVDKYRSHYEGKFPRQLQDKEDDVIINLCKQVIDETASFLAPDMPTIELDKSAGATSEDEIYIKDIWQNSGGARLFNQMVVSGGFAGHVFARVVIEENRQPRIINMPAQNIIRYWLASDYTVTIGYELRWVSGDMEYRTDIRLHPSGATWDIINYSRKIKGGSKSEWSLVDNDSWAYPIAPIVSWQHLPNIGGVYGRNEIMHADMNTHVNKVMSDIKSILRYHAYPTTVGTGFKAGELQQTSINGFMSVSSPEAKIYNVEMESDLASSMNFAESLIDSFFKEARVVRVKGGVDAFRSMTNLAIRASYMPMIHKNRQLQQNYTDGIKEITRLLLMINGSSSEAVIELPIMVIWGEALPIDEREELAIIKEKVIMGWMSDETARGRMGLDHEQEKTRIENEIMWKNQWINGATDNVG